MSPSKGPWTVERRRTDHPHERGTYYYYVILDAHGKVLMDTLNSEVQTIMVEDDEDGALVWDAQGEADANLIETMWPLFEILTKGNV